MGTFFPTGSATPAQPENDHGAAVDETICFITQQSNDNIANNDDVDGGPTILASPPMTLNGDEAFISYARWVFGNGAGITDSLVTQISDDGTTWITVASSSHTNGQWEAHSFKVSDYLSPGVNVWARFVASDLPNDSVFEAGIDDVRASKVICAATCVSQADCDDGNPCTGEETCVGGYCQAGSPPGCPTGRCCLPTPNAVCGEACCDTDVFSCTGAGGDYGGDGSGCELTPLCVADAECDDADACTCHRCAGGCCTAMPIEYGNVNCAGPANAADLDDVLCALDGFGNQAFCPHADIDPPCSGDGVINLDDLLAVLDAFGGLDPCGCEP
jgi:hypothetical protein